MEVDSHFPPLTLKKEGFSEWTHKFHHKENSLILKFVIEKVGNFSQ